MRGEGGEDGGEDAEFGGGGEEACEERAMVAATPRAGLLEHGDDKGEEGVPYGAELGGVGGGGLVRVEGEPEEELVGVAGGEGGGGGGEVLVAGLDVDGVCAELGVDGEGGAVLGAEDEAEEGVAELGAAGRGGGGGGGAGEEGGPRDGGGGAAQLGEGECGCGVLGGLVFEEGGGGGCGGGSRDARGWGRGARGEGDRGHPPGGRRGAPQEAEDVERVVAHRDAE